MNPRSMQQVKVKSNSVEAPAEGNLRRSAKRTEKNLRWLSLEIREVWHQHHAPVSLDAGRPAERATELERNPQNFANSSGRFARILPTWNPPAHAWRRSRKIARLNSRGNKSRTRISINSLILPRSSVLKTSFKTKVCSCSKFSYGRYVVDQRSGDDRISGRSFRRRSQLEGTDSRILRRLMRRLLVL